MTVEGGALVSATATYFSVPSQLTITEFQVDVARTGARIIVRGATPTSGTLDESGVYAGVPFGVFNGDIWD